MITGYLLEQRVMVTPSLATALLYGIESETMGYPREASSLDDGALIWLFPRADKDLLARIRNPKLPQSHFATFQSALANAFLYDKLIFSWCGVVTQPDIIAEIADFFIRFDQVDWSLAAGVFDHQLKLSLRASQLGGRAGEVLQAVVNGMGNAGGHDKRAGGAVDADRSAGCLHRADAPDDPLPAARPARDRRAAGPTAALRLPRHPRAVTRIARSRLASRAAGIHRRASSSSRVASAPLAPDGVRNVE